MKTLSLREIRYKYQKTRHNPRKFDNWFSRELYTRLAAPLIKLLLLSRITANQVTVAWVIIGFLGCFFFIFGNYLLSLLAVLLIQFHMVLDDADGAIARARKTISFKGIYIERIGHDSIFTIYFFCLALGAIKKGFSPLVMLIFGFLASFGYFFYKHTRRTKIFCSYIFEEMNGQEITFTNKISAREGNNLRKQTLFRQIYRKTQIVWEPVFFINMTTIVVLFDMNYIIPLFYGLTYPVHFVISFIYQAKIDNQWVNEWRQNLKRPKDALD